MNINDARNLSNNNSLKKNFGEEIKRLREAKGLNQTQLASNSSLDSAFLSRLLSGDKKPKIEHILALANALDVTPIELVYETEYCNLLEDWVTMDQYRAIKEEKDSLYRKTEELETENIALRSEVEEFKKRITKLGADNLKLTDTVFLYEKSLEKLTVLRNENDKLIQEKFKLQSAKSNQEQQINSLKINLNQYKNAYENNLLRMEGLERLLRESKADKVSVGIISAALAATVTAAFTLDKK